MYLLCTCVLTGITLDQPRDIIKALNPSLAAMVQKSNIDSNRMKLGKIIGEGNIFTPA